MYATDRDAGDNGRVEYFMNHDPSGSFSINQYNGWVHVDKPIAKVEVVVLMMVVRVVMVVEVVFGTVDTIMMMTIMTMKTTDFSTWLYFFISLLYFTLSILIIQ